MAEAAATDDGYRLTHVTSYGEWDAQMIYVSFRVRGCFFNAFHSLFAGDQCFTNISRGLVGVLITIELLHQRDIVQC